VIITLDQPFTSDNMFDNLPALVAPPDDLRDELDKYLLMDCENVLNPLLWWFEHKSIYPHLSRMALDYLSIPGEYWFHLNLFPLKISI
jgi:hAT family C-terminal dimerisation region